MARDVLIVGGGVAGLTASIHTARAGLDTLVVSEGPSIVERSAHMENFPGFPAGVDPRLFARMLHDQADEAGAKLVEGRVIDAHRSEAGFRVTTRNGYNHQTERLVIASWQDLSWVGDDITVERTKKGSKEFLQVDYAGRTDEGNVYATGRIANQYHQATVAAGHGAKVGITIVRESDVDYYHDWVAPEGYFTERDREVPPGCEEIDDEERERRAERSREVMQEYFSEPVDREPVMHPDVVRKREREETKDTVGDD